MRRQPHYKVKTASAYKHGGAVPRSMAVEHLGAENVANAEAYAAANGLSIEFCASMDGEFFTGVYTHMTPKKSPASGRANHGKKGTTK